MAKIPDKSQPRPRKDEGGTPLREDYGGYGDRSGVKDRRSEITKIDKSLQDPDPITINRKKGE